MKDVNKLKINIKQKVERKRADQVELDNDWRPIKGFPHYQINRHGQVKRLSSTVIDKNGIAFYRRGRILATRKTRLGYVQVDMCENGVISGRFIHVLLAQAFIPNPNNYPLVNHKDENPSNNDLSNLEWCNHSYNALHSVERIREAHAKERRAVCRIDPKTKEEVQYIGIRDAARKNKVHHSNIRHAILHNSYCGGYKWKYV